MRASQAPQVFLVSRIAEPMHATHAAQDGFCAPIATAAHLQAHINRIKHQGSHCCAPLLAGHPCPLPAGRHAVVGSPLISALS